MIDVKLISTPDGGDIDTSGGGIALDYSVETAIQLSVEGGNFDDSGDAADAPKQWWGNYATNDEAEWLRSRTQAVLRQLPATLANLKAVTEAVLLDIAWMANGVVFDSVKAGSQLIGRNRVQVNLDTTQNGKTVRYAIRAPWSHT